MSLKHFIVICKKQNNIFAFLSTVILGLILHFPMAAYQPLIRDGLWNIDSGIHISGNWEASLGRWAIHIIDKLRGGIINIPMIILISLFFLGLTSILLSKLFNVKNKIIIFCISALLTVSPQIINIFCDIYCADSYCLSIFLSTLSIFLLFDDSNIISNKLKIVLSLSSLVFSLGLYQAGVGIATCLAVFLFFNMLKNNEPIDKSCNKFFKALFFIILGLIIYYLIAKVYLKFLGISFSSYRGANSLSLSSIIKNIPDNIKYAYSFNYKYFFLDDIVINHIWNKHLLWLTLFSLFIISFILFAINNKNLSKKNLRIVLMILCILILPISLSTIKFITPSDINLLVATPWIMVGPCILAIIYDIYTKHYVSIKKVLVVFLGLVLVWSCAWQIDASYVAIDITCKQASTIAQNIYCKATSLSDYSEEYPYLFYGSYSNG